MAILYRKPKLKVDSSYYGEDILAFNFKLEFQPCEEFLEIILNFFPGPDYEGKLIAEHKKDFYILSSIGIGYTFIDNYLRTMRIYMNNSKEFELLLKIKNDMERDYNKYLIFEIKDSNLFYAANSPVSGLIPRSDMKKLNSLQIFTEYAPQTGSDYISENEQDIEITNTVDYSADNLPYLPVLSIATAPTVAFATSSIAINEGSFDQQISITRTGDLSLNSLVRLDITSGTAEIPNDAIVFTAKYIRFNSGDAIKYFTVAALTDIDAVEITENLIFTLTSEDNAVIGANNTLTVEINNVV